MAKLGINTGIVPDDGLGDSLLDGAVKINDNFDEIYTYFGDGTNLTFTTFSGDYGDLSNTPVNLSDFSNDVGFITSFIDTDTNYWTQTSSGIHTLSNVGIGTTNPTETLTVVGDARVTGILTIGTASITLDGSSNTITVGSGVTIDGSTGIIEASSLILDGTTFTGTAVTSITAGSGISVDQSTGNVTISAAGGGGGGESYWAQTSAGIHTLSNVGIGTTNPTSALTVKGNTSLETLRVSGFSTFTSPITVTGSQYSIFGNGLVVQGTAVSDLKGNNFAVQLQNGLQITNGNIEQAYISAVNGDILTAGRITAFNGVSVSGVSTFAGITTVTGPTLFTKQLNVSGVSTLGIVTAGNIYSTGIVTATNFSGNGSTLTGIVTSIVGGTGVSITQTSGNVTISATGISTGIYINVKDYGALGNGTTDDTVAIQNAINANPGRVIYFPAGKYLITSAITISTSGTKIFGESMGEPWRNAVRGGSCIISNSASNAIVFDGSSTSLYGCGIQDIAIARTTSISSGIGVQLIDAIAFTCSNVFISEFFTCLELKGAKQCSFQNIRLYTGNSFITPVSGSSLLNIIASGTSTPDQAGWINSFVDCQITSDLISDSCIRIISGDSTQFTNMYVAGAKDQHVLVEQIDNVPLHTTTFNQVYFDGIAIDPSPNTPIAVYFRNTTTHTTLPVDFKLIGCTMGQLDIGVYFESTNLRTVQMVGCHFHNIRDSAVYGGFPGTSTNFILASSQFNNCSYNSTQFSTVKFSSASNLVINGNCFNTVPSTARAVIELEGVMGAVSVTGNAISSGSVVGILTSTFTPSRYVNIGNAIF